MRISRGGRTPRLARGRGGRRRQSTRRRTGPASWRRTRGRARAASSPRPSRAGSGTLSASPFTSSTCSTRTTSSPWSSAPSGGVHCSTRPFTCDQFSTTCMVSVSRPSSTRGAWSRPWPFSLAGPSGGPGPLRRLGFLRRPGSCRPGLLRLPRVRRLPRRRPDLRRRDVERTRHRHLGFDRRPGLDDAGHRHAGFDTAVGQRVRRRGRGEVGVVGTCPGTDRPRRRGWRRPRGASGRRLRSASPAVMLVVVAFDRIVDVVDEQALARQLGVVFRSAARFSTRKYSLPATPSFHSR